MIQQIRKHLSIILLVALIAVTGCKSKKKAMEAANATKEKARIEQEQAEKKSKSEELARKEQEAKERSAREEEALRLQRETKASTPVKLGQYFSSISSSTNTTAANNNIKEALTLFASPETPVLIVISNEGGVKDYDKPTTIKDYLNYLKDQKKNINSVSDIKTDGSGKITELELRKD